MGGGKVLIADNQGFDVLVSVGGRVVKIVMPDFSTVTSGQVIAYIQPC